MLNSARLLWLYLPHQILTRKETVILNMSAINSLKVCVGNIGIQLRFARLTIRLLAFLVAGCAASSDSTLYIEHARKAEAIFAERCKRSGEKISHVVSDVEGVLLIKGRPVDINYGDQFRMDDPYGSDFGGDSYVASFLRPTNIKIKTGGEKSLAGYHFIDAIDRVAGKTYRYTGDAKEVEVVSSILVGGTGKKFKSNEFVLNRMPASDRNVRYAVTYDDISTQEDREYWIAGSSLRIIDLQTNEVIGERIGYMIDVAQGSTQGGRSPWLFAADHACPPFSDGQHGAYFQMGQSARFVKSILKPMGGENK